MANTQSLVVAEGLSRVNVPQIDVVTGCIGQNNIF